MRGQEAIKMILNNSKIMMHKMMNAPKEFTSFGIEEVANAPSNWGDVSNVTQQLGDNRFTKTQLVHAVRAVNRILRQQGIKTISVGKKSKEDLVDELDMVCYQDTEMYGLTARKNKNLLLTVRTLKDFAMAGLLTQELGTRAYLEIGTGKDIGVVSGIHNNKKRATKTISDKEYVEAIVTSSHKAFNKSNWVNSACETEGFVGKYALDGFGTESEIRYACNQNHEAVELGSDSYAVCVSEKTGVMSYAPKNTKSFECPNCKGPAELQTYRHSVSKKNGTFLSMPLIKLTDSPFKTIGMSARTHIVKKERTQMTYDEFNNPIKSETIQFSVREKTDSIQPRLYPIHIQKNGGRVARKIDGRTVWKDVYFQQLVFESETSQSFAVWCAVECFIGDNEEHPLESKKLLNRVFMPRPSILSTILVNTLLNDASMSFTRPHRPTVTTETIGSGKNVREVMTTATLDELIDTTIDTVEDGAGVV